MVNPLTGAVSRIGTFVTDLFQPELQVLAPYTRQRGIARSKLLGIAGLIALGLVGAVYGYLYALLPPYFLLYLIAPIAFMMLITIWVLPDQDTAPTGIMVKFFFAFLIVSVLWPNYVAIALPGLPWISMRRLMLFPMTLCLLIGLSISSRFREQMKEYLSAWPLIPKMLGCFVVIQFVSISMAGDKAQAVKEFVNYQTVWTAIFFVSVYAFQNRQNMHRLFRTILVCAIILSFMGIAESYQQKVLWLDHIPSFLKVDQETLELYTGNNFRDGFYRVKTTFSNALPYAEFMAMASPIVLHYIFRTRFISLRILLVAIDLLIFYAMSQAQARLGMLGFITGHTLFGLLWATRRWRTNRVSLLGPAASLAYPAAIAMMCVAIVSVSALNNKVLGSAATKGSNEAREAQFRRAIPKIAVSPIFGYGPRQGGPELGFRTGSFLTIDSYLLSIALDYGLVGFVLYYGLLVLAMARAFQLLMRAEDDDSDLAILILSMLSIFMVTRLVLSQEDNNSIPFMLIAMVMALYRHNQSREQEAAGPALVRP